ncbi:uncharacterized protein LOC101745350 [Bombyx mori]|uniref:G-protein coupled receptors family 1 profile domain-containing protein n=1 Tax=Bombyx mori TaxID=7091 RepID=A0A8R1WP04_BOMMO|nr:uncharacterized protein LOC101745350 [Bombyx mori]
MSESARSAGSLVSPYALAAYVACIAGVGALLNCSLVAALLRTSKNGLMNIIIQLAVADLILESTIIPELCYYNFRTWQFSNNGCIIYRGFNVLASTACSYFVVTIALHTLAIVSLGEKIIMKRIKQSEHEDDEELRSSRHSLVASSDSSTPPRTMHVDYRLNVIKIPVIQPIIFIWILSLSLSVPDFFLATALPLDDGSSMCVIADTDHRLYVYSVLAIFNLILPTVLLTISGFLVAIKLKSKRVLTFLDSCESTESLKLSLWLILTYIILCAPRSIFSGYILYSSSLTEGNNTSFIKTLHSNDTTTTIKLALSGASLGSAFLRPILCILLLPSVRKVLAFGSLRADVNHV